MNNRKNILLMYLIVFFQGFVFYGSVATLYRTQRGVSLEQIYFIESIYWVLIILFEIPWGWFADRFGYKRTLVIANGIYLISKIVFLKATGFSMFLVERIFLALALAGLSGCDSALLYNSIGDENQSEKIFGRYTWWATSGFLMASVISSIIIKESMQALAFYTVIAYGVAFIGSLFLDEVASETEDRPNIFKSLKMVFKNKKFIVYIVSYSLMGEVVQSITVFLNQGQYQKSGIDIKYFGILLALIQVFKLACTKSYQLSEKFGKERTIGGLFIIITLGTGALVGVSSAVTSVILIGLIAGCMAIVGPIGMDLENKIIKTGDRATILSAFSVCGSLVAAGVNPVIGMAAGKTLEQGIGICFVIGCIACGLIILAFKNELKINKF